MKSHVFKLVTKIILVSLVFQSCAVYQKNISLSEAEGKGRVEIISTQDRKLDFVRVNRYEDSYYGIRNKKDSIQLNPSQISAVYIKPKVYRAWIRLENNAQYNGVLYSVTDSSIVIAKGKKYTIELERYKAEKYEMKEFQIHNIMTIKTRKLNTLNTGARAGIGALVGFIFGAGIGYVTDEPSSCTGFWCIDLSPLKTITGGIVGALTGALIGALSGEKDEYYRINGNLDNFRNCQDTLTELAIIK